MDHAGDPVAVADGEGTDDEAAEGVADRDDRCADPEPVEQRGEFVGEGAVRLGRVGRGPRLGTPDPGPVFTGLLGMLVYRDFAEQLPDRRYGPGPLMRGGRLPPEPVVRLREAALPHLRRLVDEQGETANLVVLATASATQGASFPLTDRTPSMCHAASPMKRYSLPDSRAT